MKNEVKHQNLEKIRYDMSLDTSIPSNIVLDSTSFALKDEYLYELLMDWLKEHNEYNKDEMKKEIVNYTDEILRKKKLIK